VVRRNRTSSSDIGYGLYLYFLGLSTRNVARALSFLHIVKRSHVAVWKWIQRYKPQKVSNKRRKKIKQFIIDETQIKVGSQYIWLWVAIEPKNSQILALSISNERNMLIAERFLSSIVKDYGKNIVSTDGGTWYPQACRFLKLKHHLHSPLEKSLIERTIQYIKDRTESFDDYFPCNRKEKCNLFHVKNWLALFVDMHNKQVLNS
jgi:putative transposase